MPNTRRCAIWMSAILALTMALAASTVAGVEPQADLLDVRLESKAGYCVPAVGETFVVDVMVYAVEGLNGTQFELSYDPDVLEILDANEGMPGVQIGDGALFTGQYVIVSNTMVDETEGTIEYYCFITGGASTPARGTGSLARITFKVLQAKDTSLEFTKDQCFLPRDPDLVPPETPNIDATWHDQFLSSDCGTLFLPRVSGR